MSALKISEAASLAIHTIVVLAANPGETLSVGEIADSLKASKDHLSKVLQRLARGGFVKSARGPRGGFILARPADEIHLLEVFEYIEGPYDIRDCLLDERICGRGKCPMGKFIYDVNANFKRFLTETTFAELARNIVINVKDRGER